MKIATLCLILPLFLILFNSVLVAEPKPQKPRILKFLERISRVARHELGIAKKGIKAKRLTPLEPQFKPSQCKGAAFEIYKEIPLLHLSGTPYEMGYQHGKLLGPQIARLNQFYLDVLMGTGKKREKAFQFVKKMEPYIPKEYIEEMKGIADGAGLSYDTILFAHTFLDVFHSQLVACSTAGVNPERSKTGETLFGRNLDFPSLGFVHKFSMIIVYRPKGKPAFISIAWPGLAGVLTGMNEHGLALGMLSIQFEDYNQGGYPMFWLFRSLLENCKTVPEALEVLKKTRLSVASNLTLADKKGVAVAELLPRNKRFRLPKHGIIHSTNHFQHRDIKKFIPSGTYTSSFVRSRIIDVYLKREPKMDWKYVQKILKAVCIKGINLQSMVFVPASKKLYIGMHSDEAAKKKFTLFEWREFFVKR